MKILYVGMYESTNMYLQWIIKKNSYLCFIRHISKCTSYVIKRICVWSCAYEQTIKSKMKHEHISFLNTHEHVAIWSSSKVKCWCKSFDGKFWLYCIIILCFLALLIHSVLYSRNSLQIYVQIYLLYLCLCLSVSTQTMWN